MGEISSKRTLEGVWALEVTEAPSAGVWVDSAFIGGGAGGSSVSTDIGSSFFPRRKPGNKPNRFGEVERGGFSLTGGSTAGG